MVAAGEDVVHDSRDGAPSGLVGFEHDVHGCAGDDGGCLGNGGVPAWGWSLAVHCDLRVYDGLQLVRCSVLCKIFPKASWMARGVSGESVSVVRVKMRCAIARLLPSPVGNASEILALRQDGSGRPWGRTQG